MIEFEPGYTPKNLRSIVQALQEKGMTQQQIADAIGSGRNTLGSWCADIEQNRHRNMPQEKWKEILKLFHSTY